MQFSSEPRTYARLRFWNVPLERRREVEAAWRTLHGMFPDMREFVVVDSDNEVYRCARLTDNLWSFRHLPMVNKEDI
jgi:hypothetical protein